MKVDDMARNGDAVVCPESSRIPNPVESAFETKSVVRCAVVYMRTSMAKMAT